MLVGDRADDLAVHFLGPGLVNIIAAQPRLDMADGYLAIIGRQCADHRGCRIALHDYARGLFRIHHCPDAG